MFDLSLVELAVIALVALLVLGPERLPRAARTVGLYARRARQSWYSVKSDIERELAADELRRSMQAQADAATRSAEALRRDITGPDPGATVEDAAPKPATGDGEPGASASPETGPDPDGSTDDGSAPRP